MGGQDILLYREGEESKNEAIFLKGKKSLQSQEITTTDSS